MSKLLTQFGQYYKCGIVAGFVKKEGAILVVSTRDRNTDSKIDYADFPTRLVFLNEFDPEYQ